MQALQYEIVVSLIALRLFTCCCYFFRGSCISQANVYQLTLFSKLLNEPYNSLHANGYYSAMQDRIFEPRHVFHFAPASLLRNLSSWLLSS